MLLFVLLSLSALLLIYLVRVIQLDGNAPNSFIVVPLIIGILISGVMEFQWESGERKGSHLVTYVSGVTSSDLDCQRMSGAFYDYSPEQKGWVDKDDPKTVNMKYDECMALVQWFNSEQNIEPATSHQAFALHLLIFEANKVKNINITDAEAECKATSQYLEVAKYAGATAKEAARMLDMYKSEWYPYMSEDIKKPCP
jgi:hypothetical protein